MKSKLFSWSSLTAGILTTAALTGPAYAQSSDALIETLKRKGILTEQEAEDVKSDLDKEHKDKTAKDVRFYWKNGLNFQSGDGKTFKGKLGGRLQLDAAAFSENGGIGPQDAGTEFRRARLFTQGEINTSVPVFYKFQLDFAGAEVSFKDVYLGLDDLPVVGKLKLGHFKEPVGLEELTSSKYITFMERSLPMEAFVPSRNTGVAIGNSVLDQRATWTLGAFTDTSLSGGDDDGTLKSDYRVSARLTGLPYYDEESKGAKLVHLGVSGSVIDPEDDMVRFRARPEAHLADRLVDTQMTVGTNKVDIAADHAYLLGLEAAMVYGPFSLQGEYVQTWVDDKAGANPSFYGYYGYASWFITGEHRPYKKSSGTFDRVKPKRNFSLSEWSPGAWELGVRYSHLNLNDEYVMGGRLNDLTVGLNWYWNPNARMMFNYVHSDRRGLGADNGELHAFMTRLQVDF